jgi:hypothetical protein
MSGSLAVSPTTRPFTAAYYNAGGLSRHDPAVLSSALLTLSNNADIICIAETWLQAPPTSFSLPGYVAHHCMRPGELAVAGRHGGGVSVFLRDCFVSQFLPVVTIDHGAGIVWVCLPTCRWEIALCYFSPWSSTWRQQNGNPLDPSAALSAGILRIRAAGFHPVVVGDMNARIGAWAGDIMGEGGVGPAVHDPMAYVGIPTTRCTDDTVVNMYGEGLKALLQASGMVVCNGRAPGAGANALTFVSHNGGGGQRD